MHDRITVFRAGTFTTEPQPAWMQSIITASDRTRDWDGAIRKVLGERVSLVGIDNSWGLAPTVMAWRTPEGGYYIDMMGADTSHAEVWLPDPADWLPFHSAHIEPFLHARATIRLTEGIDRIANALISWARHGEGRHIDRYSGESSIDHREDVEREKRARATAAAFLNTHSNRSI